MIGLVPNRIDDIESILKMQVIAVVGCSNKPERASNQVASYLMEAGYRVIPVHPGLSEVLGQKCYPSLSDIPEPVDAVDVFRRSDQVLPIVKEAVKIKAKAVWMQDGVQNPEAEALARKSGMRVVSDDCIMRQHLSRFGR